MTNPNQCFIFVIYFFASKEIWVFALWSLDHRGCVALNPTLNSTTTIVQITQKITALLDAQYQWQTGFQDPASGSMEEILVFNKHLTFFLVFIVLFVGWFLACTVYYFVELNNLYYNKFVHSKEFKDVWCFVSSPLFFSCVFRYCKLK